MDQTWIVGQEWNGRHAKTSENVSAVDVWAKTDARVRDGRFETSENVRKRLRCKTPAEKTAGSRDGRFYVSFSQTFIFWGVR